MKGVQIKIAGKWIFLPEDFSISLEQNNPLFNEQGTFSFPFEVPLEPNRWLFKNIADPFGDMGLKDLDKQESEVWFDGVMLYRGIVEVEDEIEFEDAVTVTFSSGNSDFMSRIEEMNARDVNLDREIKLGFTAVRAEHVLPDGEQIVVNLPDDVLMAYTEVNVSEPYPSKPYCNVRVCTQAEEGGYVILQAKRAFSGVCFYVMYFLDCLFKQLGIHISENQMYNVEDMTRLAFFTTRCEHTLSEEETVSSLMDILHHIQNHSFGLVYIRKPRNKLQLLSLGTNDFNYVRKDVYATKDNFPDVDVSSIISDLESAFGLKLIYSGNTNSMRIVFLKEILSQSDMVELDIEILSVKISRSKYDGVKLTYGEEEDTMFAYSDYSNVKVIEGYSAIRNLQLTNHDRTCYVDSSTGNAYRVKVDKDSGGNPVLFEVGGFNDYIVQGDKGGEEEERSINFTPVIVNDVSENKYDSNSQTFAVFADVELKKPGYLKAWRLTYLLNTSQYSVLDVRINVDREENYDVENEEESPLRSYDAGYVLGVMRGPGNDGKIEVVTPDYDGEGNDSYVTVSDNYAFTADSCDNYGRFFDYNGTEAGGVDQSGRFSLKLAARKQDFPIGNQYKDRGLVAKFLSEYLYFMANKKTIVLEVHMNIVQIIGIDFLKRYRIGDYVGFINKVSYTLGNGGLSDITIELYTL